MGLHTSRISTRKDKCGHRVNIIDQSSWGEDSDVASEDKHKYVSSQELRTTTTYVLTAIFVTIWLKTQEMHFERIHYVIQ